MDNERIARAALSRLMEPQDAAGLALVQAAGAQDALRIATGQAAAGPALEQEITGAPGGQRRRNQLGRDGGRPQTLGARAFRTWRPSVTWPPWRASVAG